MNRVLGCVVIAALACGDDSGATPDAAVRDASTDTTSFDSSIGDAGEDAAMVDGGSVDAPAPDVPAIDTGTMMAGSPATRGDSTFTTESDTLTASGRSVPVVAYVPEDARGIVVFLPGFQLGSERYADLCEHVASHGFVVVRADPPATLIGVSHTDMRDDAIAVLDWAARFGSLPTGIMGHSLGGKVATMVSAADTRISALLGLDPVNGGNPFTGYSATLPDIVPELTATLTIPVGYMGETTNSTGGGFGMACAPADQNFQTFYDGSSSASAAIEWDFTGADHMDFVSDTAGCGFTCSACPDGPADDAMVRAGMNTIATAYFRRYLASDAAMDAFLTGGSVPGGVVVRSR